MNFIQNHPRFLLYLSIFLCLSCKPEKVDYGPDIYVDDPGFKVVGYLPAGDFDEIDQIELERLTYLDLAFANPDAEGNLIFSSGTDIGPVVKKGHNAGLKVLVSLAGGGRPDPKDWKRVLRPSNRSAFISNIVKFVEENNLDGVDVDIEGNLLPDIGKLYTPFVLELRDALHAKGKTITTALGAANLHPGVTQESLEAYDFINIMVYDKTGPWRPEKPGQHSPYSYAEDAYKFWSTEKKIPTDRLVLGMPFYGHNFDPPGSKRFGTIVEENISDAYIDQVDQVYYNGIPTIVKKTELAKEKFGGVMFWQLAQDKYSEDLSLLRAVDQTLKAGDCKVSVFFKDEDGDGFGDLAKPFHACEAPEGYVSNSDDVDDSDAASHP
ncbi:glycosyl hydrolase family 18 protein [Bacteroidota bacterium]